MNKVLANHSKHQSIRQALVTGNGKVPFPVTHAYNLHIFLSVCSFTEEGREQEFGKKQLQSVL